jgi:hypothetical protein
VRQPPRQHRKSSNRKKALEEAAMRLDLLPHLRTLWPHGNARVPGLIEGIAASALAVFAKYGSDATWRSIALGRRSDIFRSYPKPNVKKSRLLIGGRDQFVITKLSAL